MISPADGEQFAKQIRAIYDQAELDILSKIARRVSRGGADTDPSHWLEQKLGEVRRHQAEVDSILKQLEKEGPKFVESYAYQSYISGMVSADTDLLTAGVDMKKAAIKVKDLTDTEGISATFGSIHTGAVSSLVAAATEGLKNAHVRIARQARDAYREVVTEVASSIVAGIDTREQATQRALNKFADKKIGKFTDKSGKNWDIATYAEMSMRTTSGQAMIQGHVNRLQEQGRDLVIVSDHPEESDLCRPHEGKIYSLTGKTKGYKTLKWAIADGLFHPNCRHNITAYIEGLTEPPKVTADPEGYKVRQKQRYMERQVRAWKKREAVAVTPKEKALAKRKVGEWQQSLRDFTGIHDRRRKYAREKIHPSLMDKGPTPHGPMFSGKKATAEIVKAKKTMKVVEKELKDDIKGVKAAAPAMIPETTLAKEARDSIKPPPVEITKPPELSPAILDMWDDAMDDIEDLYMWLDKEELDELEGFVNKYFGGDGDKAIAHIRQSMANKEVAAIQALSDRAKQEILDRGGTQTDLDLGYQVGSFRANPMSKLSISRSEILMYGSDSAFLSKYTKRIRGQREVLYDRIFEDAEAKMDALWETANPTIRISPTAFGYVVNEGRFKTQFEVKASGGAYAPQLRAEVEESLMGIPENLDPKKRPIYGLMDNPQGTTQKGEWYGSLKVRLKQEKIKDRMTITLGDSLDRSAIGVKFGTTDNVRYQGRYIPDLLKAKNLEEAAGKAYTEIQVHGGVSLSDIWRVDVPERDLSDINFRETLRQVESQGIEVVVYTANNRKRTLAEAFKHLGY